MIVECNVWCVGNTTQQIDLGLPEGDRWMPIAIDFSTVVAIKLAGENEFVGDDKSVLYFDNNHLTVDIEFKDALKIWIECKK